MKRIWVKGTYDEKKMDKEVEEYREKERKKYDEMRKKLERLREVKDYKDVELDLNYFKKGDDADGYLEHTNQDVIKALRLHADVLEQSVKQLRNIAMIIADSGRIDDFFM